MKETSLHVVLIRTVNKTITLATSITITEQLQDMNSVDKTMTLQLQRQTLDIAGHTRYCRTVVDYWMVIEHETYTHDPVTS